MNNVRYPIRPKPKNKTQQISRPNITDVQINEYLDSRGIRYACVGRKYLFEIIRLRLQNPSKLTMTTAYDIVAENNNTSLSSVERTIRHSIATSLSKNTLGQPTKKYQPNGKVVTNKEFVERAITELLLAEKKKSRIE